MRIYLCLLLALGVAPAWAATWVQVKETKDVVFYIDPTSISKAGHLRKAWELSDLKRRTKRGVMSIRVLFEYDCRMQKVRGLSGVSFSKPMAEGVILSSISTFDWQDVIPGTDDAVTFKFVCAR